MDRAGRTRAPATSAAIPGATADPTAGDGASSAPPQTEPSQLEMRYRRWLRVLPRAYRAAREQEMVDTFLESEFRADPENADLTAKFGGVGLAEALSVLALALRLRWADPLGPPRFRARAAALPLATLGCLTVLAVSAAVGVCGRFWLLAFPPEDLAVSPWELAFGTAPGIESIVLVWSFVLWIPALALALSGRRGSTMIAALVAAVPAAVTLIEAFRQPAVGLQGTFDWALAAVQWSVVTALATMAGTARSVDPTPRGPYVTAVFAGIVAYESITVVMLLGPPATVLYPVQVIFFGGSGGLTGFWFVAVLVAAVVLAVRSVRGTRPTVGTLLALAAVAGATTLLLLTGFPAAWQMFRQGEPPWDAPFVAAVIQLALAAVITVTAGILAARRIHRLPAVRY